MAEIGYRWLIEYTWYDDAGLFYSATKVAGSDRDAALMARRGREGGIVPHAARDLEVNTQKQRKSGEMTAWQAAGERETVVLEVEYALAPGVTDPTAPASRESTRYWLETIRAQMANATGPLFQPVSEELF